MIIKTRKVRLYPNSYMRKVLDSLCDYRRYCWNQGLELWNDMYEAHLLNKDNPLPNNRTIRNIMIANKQDWQYSKSSRVLQQSIKDLSEAWQHFFRKDQSYSEVH